jgi:hypothetical protein
MTTPVQSLGFTVGELYEVMNATSNIPIGTLLELYEDDGSAMPYFICIGITLGDTLHRVGNYLWCNLSCLNSASAEDKLRHLLNT